MVILLWVFKQSVYQKNPIIVRSEQGLMCLPECPSGRLLQPLTHGALFFPLRAGLEKAIYNKRKSKYRRGPLPFHSSSRFSFIYPFMCIICLSGKWWLSNLWASQASPWSVGPGKGLLAIFRPRIQNSIIIFTRQYTEKYMYVSFETETTLISLISVQFRSDMRVTRVW